MRTRTAQELTTLTSIGSDEKVVLIVVLMVICPNAGPSSATNFVITTSGPDSL